MASDSERRSSVRGIQGQQQGDGGDHGGVGGRQTDPPSRTGGGGYQDTCNSIRSDSGGAEEARLAELEAMGLDDVWLEIARTIGTDNFLAVWKIVDFHDRPKIPKFSIFRRFQRNLLIGSFVANGMRPVEIDRVLGKELCEKLSSRHIRRLIATARRSLQFTS